MPSYESEIQKNIIDAVEFFFTAPDFGYQIPYEKIRVVTPASGGQARKAEDFGRKPYDFAFYADKTIVLFFEVKERLPSGRLSEFKSDQKDMLNTLAENGVDIRYAYNSWNFDWGRRLTPPEVLQQAHVREAKDMKVPILTKPLHPALILEDYLRQAASSSNHKFVDVLAKDIRQIANLNSMPLMVLANLDGPDVEILIDRAPSGALRMMKKLFNLASDQRDMELLKYSLNPNGAVLHSLASSIFSMKDNWELSNQSKLRP
jgi:hypothetical protein